VYLIAFIFHKSTQISVNKHSSESSRPELHKTLKPYSVRHNRLATISETIKSTIKFHQNYNLFPSLSQVYVHQMCCNFPSTCTFLSSTFHVQKAKSNFASFKNLPYIDFIILKKSNFKPKYLRNHSSDIQDMHIPTFSKSTPFICNLFHLRQ
jgi:hypothetical protein